MPRKNHKYTAKIPGRRSKKTNLASEFENQVAKRVSEAMIIDEIYSTMDNDKSITLEPDKNEMTTLSFNLQTMLHLEKL